MKETKKILSLILALAMAISLVPAFSVAAFATDDTLYINASWTSESCEGHTWGTDAFNQLSSAVAKVTTITTTKFLVSGNGDIGSTETTAGEGVEFTTGGAYTIIGTEWANLGYLQFNPTLAASTNFVLNIGESGNGAKLVIAKPQLRCSSNLNLTDSHLDFASQQGAGNGYLFVFKDSAVTVTNSVMGYSTAQGNSSSIVAGTTSAATQGNMNAIVYGSFTAENSTVYSYSSMDQYGSFEVLDRGIASFKDSVLYSHHTVIGDLENRIDRYTVGRDDKVATLVLDNSKMYANTGDKYALVVGDDKDGKLCLKNSSVIDYASVDATVKSNGYVELDATSKLILKKLTNNGVITVDMTGATATKIKLIDCSDAATTYGALGVNYKFAQGKDYGYTLKVINNDLYALAPVASITVGSGAQATTTYYATLESAIDAAQENTIKIVADIDLDETTCIGAGETVTIDLNGHVINGSNLDLNVNSKASVFYSEGNLNIFDNNKTAIHYFEYSSRAAWTLTSGAFVDVTLTPTGITSETLDGTVVRVEGGVITGGKGTAKGSLLYGGGILCSAGSLTITGCSIIGNSLSGNVYGGGIANRGIANIFDCVIAGNYSAKRAGGIYSYGTSLDVINSAVIGNIANSYGGGICNESGTMAAVESIIAYNYTAVNGGGIFNKATMQVSDCLIKGNIAATGAGIYTEKQLANTVTSCNILDNQGDGIYNGGSLVISGDTVVSGNAFSSGVVSNLYVASGKAISISNLTAGSKIGVTTQVKPIDDNNVAFTDNTASEIVAQYFFSDSRNYAVRATEGATKLELYEIPHTHDGITFDVKLGGEYSYASFAALFAEETVVNAYLTDDLIRGEDWDEEYTIPEGCTLNLCLNDYSVKSQRDYVFNVYGTLNLYDCGITERHFALNEWRADTSSTVLALGTEGIDYITIKGGYITNNRPGSYYSVGVVCNTTDSAVGTFNMYGGNIIGCHHGAVDCDRGSFHMYAGTIQGNTADCGAGVNNAMALLSFHMHGGKIQYNTAWENGGGVYNETGDVTFDGTCYVWNNQIADRSTKDVISKNNFETSVIASSIVEIIGSGLTSQSKIGVTLGEGSGAFSSGSAVNIPMFVSDADIYGIRAVGGKLELYLQRDTADPEITIPNQYNENSTTTKVIVTGDSNVEAIGLDQIAIAEKENNTDKNVKITLNVESKDETGIGNTVETNAIKTSAGAASVAFYSVVLEKTVSSAAVASTSAITEASVIIEIIIPFNVTSKTLTGVYRYHGLGVTSFVKENGQMAVPQDCHYYVDTANNLIHIYTKKFSTYAVSYTTKSSPSISYSESLYQIIAKAAQNGQITASKEYASSSDTITITAKTNTGYKLVTVSAIDSSGKVIELKDIGGGKYTFKMPAKDVTVSASFEAEKVLCPQDETCVYAPYTDTDTKAWYHDGVHFCVENKYMSGYGNNLFGPGDTLIRGMVVRILYNMEGMPKVTEKSSYTDVAEGAWYADAIAWAEDNNVVDGYGNGKFGPEDPITREQFAKVLYGYAKYKGIDVSASEEITGFTDSKKVSSWALTMIKWAKATSLMSGYPDGTLKPQGNANRAEAATMIKNFGENIAK